MDQPVAIKVFAHRDYNDEGQNIGVPSVSVCVHSDTPGAARLAEAIVCELKENDIEICPSDAPNRRFPKGAHTLADKTVKAQMPRTFYRAPDPESDF